MTLNVKELAHLSIGPDSAGSRFKSDVSDFFCRCDDDELGFGAAIDVNQR